MPKLHHRRDRCQLCESTALTMILSLAPTPPANAFVPASERSREQPYFPLDVFQCEDCHHVQLVDVVDPAVLFENYVYVSGTSPAFVKHFEDYAATLCDRLSPADDSLIIDIGSNDGTLLSFLKQRGYRVLGIDARTCRERHRRRDRNPAVVLYARTGSGDRRRTRSQRS